MRGDPYFSTLAIILLLHTLKYGNNDLQCSHLFLEFVRIEHLS